MSSVNKAVLIGRLGSDAVVRYTPSGKAVANFSIATDEHFKNNNGEKQRRTSWHRINTWDKLAEFAGQFLKKGTQVYVEGPIQYGTYNKNGVDIPTFEIKALVIQLLGSRADSEVPAGDANEDLAPPVENEEVFG